jgi:hypothetical protein
MRAIRQIRGFFSALKSPGAGTDAQRRSARGSPFYQLCQLFTLFSVSLRADRRDNLGSCCAGLAKLGFVCLGLQQLLLCGQGCLSGCIGLLHRTLRMDSGSGI